MNIEKKPYVAEGLQPMLAPNKLLIADIPLGDVRWPKLASTKYNGIRAIYLDGFFYSRSGKKILVPISYLREIKPVLDWADSHYYVLDGELNSNSFNSSGETMSIMAGTIPMPDDFKYKIFYILSYRQWNNPATTSMEDLISPNIFLPPNIKVEHVRQVLLREEEEFLSLVSSGEYSGKEGYMLLDPKLSYKHGRGTEKENLLLKYKYYSDPEDGKIVGITARQSRSPEIEVGKTELGYAKPIYTQAAFDDTDIGGCLLVKLEKTGEIISCPFPLNYPISTRRLALAKLGTGQPGDIKGRWVSFRRIKAKAGTKPMSIKNVEFRDDKD